MSFWEFANNHPFITLLCVWCVGACTASSIKHFSRAITGRSGKTVGKIEVKVPRADAKAAEKAH